MTAAAPARPAVGPAATWDAADLAGAVDRDELELHGQPVVDLARGTVVGFEALLRWRHPRFGLLAPEHVIPVAEATGLIEPIGRWVLQQACAAAARWAPGSDGRAVTIAVNVAAQQLASDGIVDDVAAALASSGLDPERLVLELTETSPVADPEAAARRLGQLRDLGAQVAIDDFGAGYSSMSHLRRFPVDIVKIDRSFIEIDGDDDALHPVVEGLLSLGRSLDLEVVAEGIEHDVQWSWLRDHRCDLGQGFLFSRPVPLADAEQLIGRSAAELAG